MAIVVTAATGQLGRRVVETLLEKGVPAETIVATARRQEGLADLAARGVRTARLDYDDAVVDDGVLGAGDTVLLVSSDAVGQRVTQHGNVVAAAKAAGVGRLVYTSAPAATDTTLVLAPEHAATEELIVDSGLPFTILRNGWYTENYRTAFEQARETGAVVSSTAGGRVASAARDDFAEAAAVVLAGDDHVGSVLELSGDVAWSLDELASTFADVLGQDVAHQDLAPADHRAVLQGAGLDEGTAGFVVALDQNIAEGVLAVTTGDLASLLGRPTTPLAESVRSWV